MAKTIKFNLVLDGNPVRTIEDLQGNFSIEDILRYYKNGLLKRWLDVRGYEKYSAAVSSIKPGLPDNKVIKDLAKAFEMPIAHEDIDKAAVILSYLEQQKARESQYKENAKNTRQIITDYFNNYNALIKHIEDNRDKIEILKADAIEIERTYFRLFVVSRRALFYRLKESAPKMIYVLLTREALQPFLIGEDADEDVVSTIQSSFKFPKAIGDILGDDAITVRPNTDGNWDPIEPKGKKVMVLYLSEGSYIRSSDNRGEKYSSTDINGAFKLLDGVDYQCPIKTNQLIYMEV